jgi:hypothetical protein
MSGLTVIAPMICAGCDQPLPPPSKKGRPRKWCSDKCRRSQRSKQRAAARAQPRICAGCDRLVPPNSSKGGRTRKWCSDECKRRTWDRENVIVFCACGQRIAPKSARQGNVSVSGPNESPQCGRTGRPSTRSQPRSAGHPATCRWSSTVSGGAGLGCCLTGLVRGKVSRGQGWSRERPERTPN